MTESIKALLEDKKIAILGFGREGRSTYNLIRKILPFKEITIIDESENIRNDNTLINDPNIFFITGNHCMQAVINYDIAVKSPGIPSNSFPADLQNVYLTSQTDLFLKYYGHQAIGITGTKGKSTTSSLIYHILNNSGRNTILVGNIGIPPFDCIDEIKPDSVIVMELSSHQLEYVAHSPHIAVLLNLFQEHLDHYHSYYDYQLAKLNIGKYQKEDDFFIFNTDNETLRQAIESIQKFESKGVGFSLNKEINSAININNEWIELKLDTYTTKLFDTHLEQSLKGNHNLYNIMAAAAACHFAGVPSKIISSGIESFKGLEHRIEYVGIFKGIIWYNDSIATIPEATIEAVKTLQIVDTLILGGFDRGIEYDILYPFLNQSGISNLIFVGKAGKRIMQEYSKSATAPIKTFTANEYNQVVSIAAEVTQKGKICLLSPAAASYDMFGNFEERGNVFKKNVRSLDSSHL